MSTRYNNGSHYQNHQRAAELHGMAAHAHNSAAEHRDHQDHLTGQEYSRQALEHSERAYLYSQEMNKQSANKAGHPSPGQETIAGLAYELWQARGCPTGSPEQDWFLAAEQLQSENSLAASFTGKVG